jgi:hypothetical protein
MMYLLCCCRPTLPEPPKLLPTIALMWPHTMAALTDPRTPGEQGRNPRASIPIYCNCTQHTNARTHERAQALTHVWAGC